MLARQFLCSLLLLPLSVLAQQVTTIPSYTCNEESKNKDTLPGTYQITGQDCSENSKTKIEGRLTVLSGYGCGLQNADPCDNCCQYYAQLELTCDSYPGYYEGIGIRRGPDDTTNTNDPKVDFVAFSWTQLSETFHPERSLSLYQITDGCTLDGCYLSHGSCPIYHTLKKFSDCNCPTVMFKREGP